MTTERSKTPCQCKPQGRHMPQPNGDVLCVFCGRSVFGSRALAKKAELEAGTFGKCGCHDVIPCEKHRVEQAAPPRPLEIKGFGNANAEASGSIRASAGSRYKAAELRGKLETCDDHHADGKDGLRESPLKNPDPMARVVAEYPISVAQPSCEDCVWHECAKFLGGCGCKCHRPPEREPQRSEVKPNEEQSQKCAAIEQARPQPPSAICDCDTPMGCVHSRMRVQPKVPMLSLSAITQIILLKKVSAEDVSYTDAEKQASIETLDSILEDIEAAAAEPAPERTPPQNIQEIAARIHERYNALNCRGYSTKDWVAALKATEQEIARSVAVPEPAAQQESPSVWMVSRDSEVDPPEFFFTEESARKNACLGVVDTHITPLYERRTRQAEPAPTPSRPSPYEICAVIAETHGAHCSQKNCACHHAIANAIREAEASALGTKEEHEN